MGTPRTPETEAAVDGPDDERTGSDSPPETTQAVTEDAERQRAAQPDDDDVPLVTDASEQRSDSVIRPDNT